MSRTRLCGFLFSGALLLWSLDVPAVEDVPPGIRVAGVLRNAAGEPVTGTIRVTFRIYANASCTPYNEAVADYDNQCLWWVGLPQDMQVVQGAFTASVPSTLDLALNPTLNWEAWFINNSASPYLGIEAAGRILQPRNAITSKGFAIQSRHAEEADVAFDLACDGCVNGTQGTIAAGAISNRHVKTDAAIAATKLAGVALAGHGHTGYLLANPALSQSASVDLARTVTASDFVDQANLNYYVDPYPPVGTTSAHLRGTVLLGQNPVASPPADALLSVGTTGQFQVSTLGQVTIAGLPYTWPLTAGVSGQFLSNDGFGTLSWADPVPAAGTGFVTRFAPNVLVTREVVGTTGQIAVADGLGQAADPRISLVSNPYFPGTGALGLPSGTELQRPQSGISTGTLRFNTDRSALEYWEGSKWMSVAMDTDILNAMPVGTIMAFAGSIPPSTWLVCDGSIMPRNITVDGVSQPDPLFAVIGTAWGAPTSGTFNIPDLRGQFLRGVDTLGDVDLDPAGSTGRNFLNPGGNTGRKVGSFQMSANQDHTHSATPVLAPSQGSLRGMTCEQTGSGAALVPASNLSGSAALAAFFGSDSTLRAGGFLANAAQIPAPTGNVWIQNDQINLSGEAVPVNAAVTWIIRARSCANGACSAACPAGMGDCLDLSDPQNPKPGQDGLCETVLTTDENCGSCGVACTLPNALTSCSTGTCHLASCNNFPATTRHSYGNCDGVESNGCETSLDQLNNCADCLVPCTRLNATPSCSNGLCHIDSCNLGWGNCNSNDPDGCETSLRTITNCVTCGTPCARANASATCAGLQCLTDTCIAPWGNCDAGLPGGDANGCETNLNITPAHCGSCPLSCVSTHATTTGCSAGKCVYSCSAGWADCSSALNDGCEMNIWDYNGTSARTHCGTCTNVCNTAHNTPICPSGSCVPVCDAMWDNCDGDSTNGCEQTLQDIYDPITGALQVSAVANCGGCRTTCSSNHQNPKCVGGQCGRIGACIGLYGDCNGLIADGCETPLTTLTSCGSCYHPCSGLPNTDQHTCADGTCQPATCVNGFGDCNHVVGQASDGCEYNFTSPLVQLPGTYLGSACSDDDTTDWLHGGAWSCPDPGWSTVFPGGSYQSTYTGNKTAYYYAEWRECNDQNILGMYPCSRTIHGHATLVPPPGADYGLYVYDMGGNYVTGANNGAGVQADVDFYAGGSVTYEIRVVFFSGTPCNDHWTLTVLHKNYDHL